MSLSIFLSYSSIDTKYKNGLHKHLRVLEHQSIVTIWDGESIKIGEDWDENIKTKIIECDFFLILISPDSVVSEYVIKVELSLAIKLKKKIFPIIVRPCNWFEMSISRYQCLPKNGKAISLFKNKDQVFTDIVEEIRLKIIKFNPNQKRERGFETIINSNVISENLIEFKGILLRVIDLMKITPMNSENRNQNTVLFLDRDKIQDKVFELTHEFVLSRNQLLNNLLFLQGLNYEKIEEQIENIFSYVTLNRVGYNIDESKWRSMFEAELLNAFNQILKESLKNVKS